MAKERKKVRKTRLFLGDAILQCDACGYQISGTEHTCPGCFATLRDDIDLQLEPIARHLDAQLLKHHPEAEFDYPGGFCDNDSDEEP